MDRSWSSSETLNWNRQGEKASALVKERLLVVMGGVRQVETHAVAMRHLVKAVFRGNRTDLYRFEQNVVTCISGHIRFSRSLNFRVVGLADSKR